MSRHKTHKFKSMAGWMVLVGAAAGVLALGVLSTSVQARTDDPKTKIKFVEPIKQWESDNSKWGKSFPREYGTWAATKTMAANTKFGGSNFRDYLKDDPRLIVMFAGNPFSKEYNQARGHFYAVDDVKATKRRNDKTPATCWTCKSPDVPRLMAKDTAGGFYGHKFDEYEKEVTNPIGCADCHNEKTMALQISRPALKEAWTRQGKDITKATKEEMRTLVCAQCHVEYYFKGAKEKYLTFPWDKGTTIEDIQAYYDENGFSDWTHPVSGAKMVKIQHPDFEMHEQGIHAYRGVSCADCHMPSMKQGNVEYTDHQIRSPLTNIQNTCEGCHDWSGKEVIGRVESIQSKNRQALDLAENAITALHIEIGEAMKRGASDAELQTPRKAVVHAQMYWDFVAATNGMGFHAPQESLRVLAKSLDFATQGRLQVVRLLAKKGLTDPVSLPDISTKEKAMAYIKPFVDAQAAPPPPKVRTR